LVTTEEKFRPRGILIYPPKNNVIFEEFFYDKFINKKINSDRIYLPIFWTNYYISKNYGRGDLSELQIFLNSLDRTKKYFTIVQYDDSILNNIDDLDILIFCQGGWGKYKNKSYIIPLNCQGDIVESNKEIFASFIGRKTHHIRNYIFDNFKNNSNFYLSDSIDYNKFKDVMSKSIFSLCPRGYGLTSFRICESLQSGSIPVYIYDQDFIPLKEQFNFSDIGILIHEEDISNIDNILSSKTKYNIDKYVENGRNIYREYFSYEGCYKTIINILNNGNKLYYLHSEKN